MNEIEKMQAAELQGALNLEEEHITEHTKVVVGHLSLFGQTIEAILYLKKQGMFIDENFYKYLVEKKILTPTQYHRVIKLPFSNSKAVLINDWSINLDVNQPEYWTLYIYFSNRFNSGRSRQYWRITANNKYIRVPITNFSKKLEEKRGKKNKKRGELIAPL